MIEISKDYALALHADGVGTKVLVAEACRKYDTIGIDCVAMNVNDILCLGAEPLALVDYLALEKPRPAMIRQLMKGLQRGAREAGVAVVGGETAVMPDVVKGFDLAATVVGIVKRNRIITGEETQPGDVILGLRSSGIHSNGLTLARKILLSPRTNPRILRELLRPTRIYVRQITKLLNSGLKIHSLVHITGGAFSKLKRIGTRANVGFFLNNMSEPPWIFQVIKNRARISDREMYRTFNMGIGFLVICPRATERRAVALVPELGRVGFVTDSRGVRVRVDGRVVEIERW